MTEWEARNVDFKFRIGELNLFKLRRRLLIYNFGHNSIRRPPLPSAPSAEQLRGTQGYLLRSAPVAGRMPRLEWKAGWMLYVPQQYERYFTDLSGSYEEYFAKFSTKTRSTLRRKLRKFAESSGGKIQFRVYTSPGEMDAFHADARSISSRSYQERMFGMGLPADESFLNGMRDAASANSVRGFLLYHQGKPVAYLYCPILEGVAQYQYLGYMPDYARLSAGTVLLLLAFENLFQDPAIQFFDFTEGGLDGGLGHKGHFSTGSTYCADMYFLRPWTSGWVAISHNVVDRVSEFSGRLLDKLGLKAGVKKIMRRLKGAK